MRQAMLTSPLSRRRFLAIAATALVAPATARAAHPFYGGVDFTRDPHLIPPPESPVDYPIESYEAKLDPRLRRQQVTLGTQAPAGTVIVDPEHRYLYFILGNQQALRYGVGVGREGFAWSGNAVIGMKRKWPRWLPPESMVERDPNAVKWANGMPGGPDNPLGARALYLEANGMDTLYRIHGTNDPTSIGKAMSSGCVRMLNEDVADLFDRVKIGTPVTVLAPGTF
ncbi:MAG: L,D-transpeptidase [Alphaproteobacteria bacterium]|nr:L,D-transpeptidase [Alphaproteobacteria bacterium]